MAAATHKRTIGRGLATGLVAGVFVGVTQILILVLVDQTKEPLRTLVFLALAYSALGLTVGLGWGLLHGLWRAWQDRDASLTQGKQRPAHHTRDVKNPCEDRGAYTRRELVQGMGAGLVAGAIVGLTEIVGLVIVAQSWQFLTSLIYAVIVYGVLGLLAGLGLGLLRSLWHAKQERERSSAGHVTWATITALLVSLGSFLVIHNRIRLDVIKISLLPPRLTRVIIADNLLLAAVAALFVALWFLLGQLAQHTRLAQLRWSTSLYAAMTLAAILIGGLPGLAPPPTEAPSATAAPPLAPHLRDRPNVLLIVAETLRADRLGCYAQPTAGASDDVDSLTPHLDALARDGVLYRQMSAQTSWTRPSVATILTSLYPTSHRTTTMAHTLPDDVITLSESLSTTGYRTAGFVTIANIAPTLNFEQGFAKYAFLQGDRPSFTFGSPATSRFALSTFLYRLYGALRPVPVLPQNEIYQNAAALNGRALTWLKANEQDRVFLFLHYFDPHDPYFAHPYDGTRIARRATPNPDPTQAPRVRQLYDGEVSYLDARLGELFQTLKEWDLYDDMLIIFTSDHGEEFYEHEGWWHGFTLYEEMLAVPLIIKYPGNAHAGTVDVEIARSLDIAPTVLDVLGLSEPEDTHGAPPHQGVSLRPGAAVTRAEFAFAEMDNASTIRSIRTRRYKLIVASRSNPRSLAPVELYDLQADPGEQNNLAEHEPDTVQRLRAALDQVMAFAQAHAVAGQAGEIDAAVQERLKQLGY